MTPNRVFGTRRVDTVAARARRLHLADPNLVILIVLIACWGSNWPIGRYALESWGQRPLLLSAVRSLLSGVLFTVFMVVTGRGAWNRRVLVVAAIASLFNVAGFLTGSIYAIHFLNGAGLASLLTYVQPLFVALLAVRFLRDTLTWKMLVAVVIGFAGVALIAIHGAHHAPPVDGMLCGIGGALSWAIGTVYLRRERERDVSDPRYVREVATVIAGPEFLIGGVFILALAVLFEHGHLALWSAGAVGGAAAFTLTGAAGWYLYFVLVNRGVTVARVSSWSFGVPLIAYVLSYFIYHETVDAWVGIGGAAIVVSIFSIERIRRVAARRPDEPGSLTSLLEGAASTLDGRSSEPHREGDGRGRLGTEAGP